jgi:F-type H+-transporting ATPase subunit a
LLKNKKQKVIVSLLLLYKKKKNLFSPLEQYDVIYPFSFGLFVSLLVPVFVIILGFFLFFFFYTLDFSFLSILLQFVFSSLVIFVLKIIGQQIGKAGFVFFPLVLSFFLLLLTCNLLSLTPFSLAITSHINVIAYLTFTINLAVFLKGFINNQLDFLKLFVPSSPLLLLFLLIPIEIFSYAIRSLSMCIRLAANIIAGHTLVFIISSFLLIF